MPYFETTNDHNLEPLVRDRLIKSRQLVLLNLVVEVFNIYGLLTMAATPHGHSLAQSILLVLADLVPFSIAGVCMLLLTRLLITSKPDQVTIRL